MLDYQIVLYVLYKLVKYEIIKRLPKFFLRKIKYFVNLVLRENKLENHLKSE